MLHDHVGPAGNREPDSRRRSKRALFVFALVSLAAHAAVIVALPDFFLESSPAKVSVLEVTVLEPEPLPVAVAQPEPTSPRLRAEPKNQPVRAPLKAARVPPAPVIDSSKPEGVPDGQFMAAPTRSQEQPPAPELKSPVAPAAVVPPSLNAAYLSNPAPRYPQAARRAGEQGTVTLRVLVRRDGSPSRVEIERSSGSPHLDAAALEAVRGWRFVPARQGANLIESWVLVPVVFRLEGVS